MVPAPLWPLKAAAVVLGISTPLAATVAMARSEALASVSAASRANWGCRKGLFQPLQDPAKTQMIFTLELLPARGRKQLFRIAACELSLQLLVCAMDGICSPVAASAPPTLPASAPRRHHDR